MEIDAMTEAQAAQLTGERLQLEDATLQLGRMIRKHPDRSVTYLCTSRGHSFVVRVFSEEPPTSEELEATRISSTARGLRPYDFLGDATVLSKGQGTWRAWATARRYADQTLQQVLADSSKERSWTFVVNVVTDVAFGLRELHRKGIAHRDLRPSNILLDSSGGAASIADYGIANRQPSRRLPDEFLRFLAPEQLSNTPLISRTPGDVYSFGKVIRAVLRGSLELPLEHRRLFDWVTFECLRVAPVDRPTMDELVLLLQGKVEPTQQVHDYSRLEQAVIADIDGRLPDVVGSHPRIVATTTKHVAQRIAHDVAEYRAYRMLLLDEPHLIHLLSTATITQLPARLGIARRRLNRVIINSVEYSRSQLNFGAAGEQAPSGGEPVGAVELDPEWRSELERVVLRETSPHEASEWQKAQLRRQLDAAARLTSTILANEVFIRSEDVAAIMSQSCPGITVDEVRLLRDMGYLLSLPYVGANLYPLFQFQTSSGLPYECVKRVADLQQEQGSVWRRSIWWFLDTPRLGGISPMAWLRAHHEPSEVVSSFAELPVA